MLPHFSYLFFCKKINKIKLIFLQRNLYNHWNEHYDFCIWGHVAPFLRLKRSVVSESPEDKWCRRWLTQPGFPTPSSSCPFSLTSQEEFLLYVPAFIDPSCSLYPQWTQTTSIHLLKAAQIMLFLVDSNCLFSFRSGDSDFILEEAQLERHRADYFWFVYRLKK